MNIFVRTGGQNSNVDQSIVQLKKNLFKTSANRDEGWTVDVLVGQGVCVLGSSALGLVVMVSSASPGSRLFKTGKHKLTLSISNRQDSESSGLGWQTCAHTEQYNNPAGT